MPPKEVRAIPYFCFWFSTCNSLSVHKKNGNRVLFLWWFKQPFAHSHTHEGWGENGKKGTPRDWDKGSSVEQKIIIMKKKYTEWRMCNQLLITCWPMCSQSWTVACNPQPIPWLYMLSVAPYGPGYPFIQLGSAVLALAVFPHSFLCPPVPARAEKPLI